MNPTKHQKKVAKCRNRRSSRIPAREKLKTIAVYKSSYDYLNKKTIDKSGAPTMSIGAYVDRMIKQDQYMNSAEGLSRLKAANPL